MQEIDNRLEDWLVDRYGRFEALNPELKRLAKHIASHREGWLLLLHDPAVPPTNNHAEHMLRPAVITRIVGGCNKTLLRALVHSILARIMVTCKQRGQKFLDLARRSWSTDQPQAINLVPLSNSATPTGSIQATKTHRSRDLTPPIQPPNGTLGFFLRQNVWLTFRPLALCTALVDVS